MFIGTTASTQITSIAATIVRIGNSDFTTPLARFGQNTPAGGSA
jgi:hypothetical protein